MNAREFHLSIGTSEGGKDLYDSTQWKNTMIWVENLPKDGSKIYVTLGTLLSNGWEYNKYEYYTENLEGGNKVYYPENDSSLYDDYVDLAWSTPGHHAENFHLKVGSTQGGTEYCDIYTDYGTYTVDNIPTDGTEIYVSVGTQTSGGWKYCDTKYNAASGPREKAMLVNTFDYRYLNPEGDTITPDPLSGTKFQWKTASNVLEYVLNLGSVQGGSDYYTWNYPATVYSCYVFSLPCDEDKVFARLTTRFEDGTEAHQDYVLQCDVRPGAWPEVFSPVRESVLKPGLSEFKWIPVENATAYNYSLGTYRDAYAFANGTVASPGVTLNIPNTGETLVFTVTPQGAGQYKTFYYGSYGSGGETLPVAPYISNLNPEDTLSGASHTVSFKKFESSSDDFMVVNGGYGYRYCLQASSERGNQGTAYFSDCFPYDTYQVEVTGLPTDGSQVYISAFANPPDNGNIRNYLYCKLHGAPASDYAEMTSPSPGEVLSGASQVFAWSAHSDARGYALDVGTSKGASDIAAIENITATQAAVTGLPVDGSVVHVRLWTLMNSDQDVYMDYTYAAFGGGGYILAPEDGAYINNQEKVRFKRIEGATYKARLLGKDGEGQESTLMEKDMGTKTSTSWFIGKGNSEIALELQVTTADGKKYLETLKWDYSTSKAYVKSPVIGTVLNAGGGFLMLERGSYSLPHTMDVGTTRGGDDLLSDVEIDNETLARGWSYEGILTSLESYQKVWIRLFVGKATYDDIYFYGPKK